MEAARLPLGMWQHTRGIGATDRDLALSCQEGVKPRFFGVAMSWTEWQKPTRRTHGWGVQIDVGLGELRGIKIAPSGNNAAELPDDFLAGLDVAAMKRRARDARELSPELVGLVRQSPAFLHGRRPRPEVDQGGARAAHDKAMLTLAEVARQRGLSAARVRRQLVRRVDPNRLPLATGRAAGRHQRISRERVTDRGLRSARCRGGRGAVPQRAESRCPWPTTRLCSLASARSRTSCRIDTRPSTWASVKMESGP